MLGGSEAMSVKSLNISDRIYRHVASFKGGVFDQSQPIEKADLRILKIFPSARLLANARLHRNVPRTIAG